MVCEGKSKQFLFLMRMDLTVVVFIIICICKLSYFFLSFCMGNSAWVMQFTLGKTFAYVFLFFSFIFWCNHNVLFHFTLHIQYFIIFFIATWFFFIANTIRLNFFIANTFQHEYFIANTIQLDYFAASTIQLDNFIANTIQLECLLQTGYLVESFQLKDPSPASATLPRLPSSEITATFPQGIIQYSNSLMA